MLKGFTHSRRPLAQGRRPTGESVQLETDASVKDQTGGALATRAGHGGGDFFTGYHFAQAIRSGEPPWLNVYRGVDMSIVGVQAWRSALADSAPFDVPDFRQKSTRRKYRDDHWSPDPARKGKGQPPSSIRGRIKLTDQALRLANKVWKSKGYDVS